MLYTFGWNDYEADSHTLALILACRRVLLEADADPINKEAYDAFHSRDTDGSDFINLLGNIVGRLFQNDKSSLTPSKESVRLVLDLGIGFINLEEETEGGESALVYFLSYCVVDNPTAIEAVALLLAGGADPRSCDSTGRSCLHVCIIYSTDDAVCMTILQLLLDAGADPGAIDKHGRSVTALAYVIPEGGVWTEHCRNRNRGLIWDQALVACGYDAVQFRQAYLDVGGCLLGNETPSEVCFCSGVDPSAISDADEAEQLPHSSQRERATCAHCGAIPHVTRGGRIWPTAHHAVIGLIPKAEMVPPNFQNASRTTGSWPSIALEWSSVAESSDPQVQRPLYTSSIQHNEPPTTGAYASNNSPWQWNYSGQDMYGATYNQLSPEYEFRNSQLQAINIYSSYGSAAYQQEPPRSYVWPLFEDLDLLEGDANVWSEQT